jgi:hypothetical protein
MERLTTKDRCTKEILNLGFPLCYLVSLVINSRLDFQRLAQFFPFS